MKKYDIHYVRDGELCVMKCRNWFTMKRDSHWLKNRYGSIRIEERG